jgi:hypothetical protein
MHPTIKIAPKVIKTQKASEKYLTLKIVSKSYKNIKNVSLKRMATLKGVHKRY